VTAPAQAQPAPLPAHAWVVRQEPHRIDAVQFKEGLVKIGAGHSGVGLPNSRPRRTLVGCQQDDGGWSQATEQVAEPGPTGSRSGPAF